MEFVPDGVLGGYCRGTSVNRSTWRVLPWHECESEYLEGTADDLRWSCLIDHRPYLTKEFPPFLELFLKLFYRSLL
jgi:hypothetical protein